MKKILFACDGTNFPAGAFEFAKQLQEVSPILLTGAFLHELNFEILLPGYFAVAPKAVMDFAAEEKADFTNTVKRFTEGCNRNMINYRVHEESREWDIDALIRETIFADLLLVSEEIFCNDGNMDEPNAFMKELLRKAQCPVMLFPEAYRSFNNVVITYNGKSDAVFALKEFCHLLPEFKDTETNIVFTENAANDDIPDLDLLKEYAGSHFEQLNFEKYHLTKKEFLSDHPAINAGSLIVFGSYNRSAISDLLYADFAEQMIRQNTNPLFIAHR